MSNGVRWYCPDVFAGAAVYTPEELGANVNESGDVIDLPAEAVKVIEPEPTPAPAMTPAAAEMAYEDACKVKNSKGMEYGEIPSDKLAHMVNSIVTALKTDLTPEDRAEREYKRDAILCILNHRATEAK